MKSKYLTPTPAKLTIAFIVITIIFSILMLFYYNRRKDYIETNYVRELSILTDSKLKRIESWRKERLGDANTISDNLELLPHVKEYLNGKRNALNNIYVEGFLGLYLKYYDYKDVILVDSSMRVMYSAGKITKSIGKPTKGFITTAVVNKKPYISNLYRSEIDSNIFINVIVPLFENKIFMGAVVLRISPNSFLFPFLETRTPGESTSETLMFYVEGDEVVALNEYRHLKNTALNLKAKINDSNKDLIAVKTVHGQTGINEGVDYRGVKVISDSRKVEDSPWYIVSKIDKSELYGPLYDDMIHTGAVAASVLILFGLGIFWIWSNRKKALQIVLLKEETQRLALLKHFEYLIKYANDIIILSDENLNILDVNDRALDVYGYTKEEVKKISLREFIVPEKTTLPELDKAKIDKAKNGLIFETIHKRKDGSSFPVEVSLRMVEVNGRKFYQRIIRDISERKKAEQEIKNSEEKFSKIFHLSSHPFALTDPADGKVLEINSGFTEALGYNTGDIIGKKMAETGVWAVPADRAAVLEKLKKGLPVKNVETRFRNKNGGEVIGLYNAEIIIINGKPLMIGNFADITAIKTSEEKFATLFHFSPVAITLSDPETSVFLDVNEGFTEVTGFKREEVIGKSALEFDLWVNKGDRDYVINELAKGNQVLRKEYKLRRRTGEIFIGYFFAGLITVNNMKIMFTSLNDITELKNAEQEIINLNRELEQRVIERTRQLEQANKELEAFSYSVSHDLRSPLRSISGFSLALYEDYYDKIENEGRDYLDRIRNAAKRMDELIDGMLKLSRVTRYDIKFEDTNISDIVKEIVDDLQAANRDKEADIKIQENISAFCDRYLVRILLENLIGNAWKYSSKNDKIIIEFGVLQEKNRRVYYIRDNGAGFDMKYYNKLFGAFQRLHTAKEYPGTGIGLATAMRIVHRHNGKIWAEGEVNKGASFFFTLN